MVCELEFGPFADDEQAFSALESAGFPVFFSDDFVRVKVEDDGFVNEDWATVCRAYHLRAKQARSGNFLKGWGLPLNSLDCGPAYTKLSS